METLECSLHNYALELPRERLRPAEMDYIRNKEKSKFKKTYNVSVEPLADESNGTSTVPFAESVLRD